MSEADQLLQRVADLFDDGTETTFDPEFDALLAEIRDHLVRTRQ